MRHRLRNRLRRIFIVHQLSVVVGLVGHHVEVAVPLRLMAITFFSPVNLHLSASSIATRMACALSGAGMMPSGPRELHRRLERRYSP